MDVDYREHEAVAAGLLFETWTSTQPTRTLLERVSPVAPYIPGQFYRRELPPLLALLRPVMEQVDVVIVDGYVWLDAGGKPGLGARLYRALGERTAVIGVAKTAFREAPAVEVRRGRSEKPLYVTAVGLSPETAAQHIREMHGEHRLPALLRRVDQLVRRG